MDWLGFISALVDSLVWPVLIVFVILVFKKSIASLLSSNRPLKSFKAGPTGLEIEYALEEAKSALDTATEEQPAPPAGERPMLALDDGSVVELPSPPPLGGELLWQNHPSAAVLAEFAALEQELRKAMEPFLQPSEFASRPPSVSTLIKRAVPLGVLEPAEAQAFRELARIRNVAAHGGGAEVTPAAAKTFIDISGELYLTIYMRRMRRWSDGEPSAEQG